MCKGVKTSELFQKHSRTIHELKQLPKQLQEIIYNKINEIYGWAITNSSNTNNRVSNLVNFINSIINENVDIINQLNKLYLKK